MGGVLSYLSYFVMVPRIPGARLSFWVLPAFQSGIAQQAFAL